MTTQAKNLSSTSRVVLQHIANGRSYQQILIAHPDLTYNDIFYAAQEALNIIDSALKPQDAPENIDKVRQKFPRAGEKWTTQEETQLIDYYESGKRVYEIAMRLQRKPGAIRSRLKKLGLIHKE